MLFGFIYYIVWTILVWQRYKEEAISLQSFSLQYMDLVVCGGGGGGSGGDV